MELKESYIAVWHKIPNEWVKIRVAQPSILAPKKELLEEYKSGKINWKEYSIRFRKQIFGNKKARRRLNEIAEISKTNTVCLVCYEKSYPCHRFLLIEYIKEILGD